MKKMKESEFIDEDRISKLQDDLLHHIFSFLDMKFVIQTSILAKRWRYLWISQPIMNFNQEVYNPRYVIKKKTIKAIRQAKHASCMEFLKWALSLHGASKIHTFRLSCTNAGDFWDVLSLDTWMPVLDQCKVEVIDILLDMSTALGPRTTLELPECIFRCRSLTTLKLDLGPNKIYKFYIASLPDCGFRSPLPSLKTLHLRSFDLGSDFQKFLSKCPVLETLLIFNCSLESSGLDIQLWQLKNLVIETTGSDRPIRVIAPNLESFRGRGAFPIHDYRFENIKSLVKAEIDTDLPSYYYCTNVAPVWCRKKTHYSPKLMECLRGINNVKTLMLSAWLLELAIEFLAGLGNLAMKPFSNLRVLTLKTSFSKGHIRATTYLLEKCQNLETLVLKMTKPPHCNRCLCQGDLYVGEGAGMKCAGKVQSNGWEEKGSWEAELAPVCKMHHLKVVEIWDAEATKNEFEFVKFLMKNAVVLEKVILYTSKTQSLSQNRNLKSFGEKLTTLPGVSSRTKIFFFIFLICLFLPILGNIFLNIIAIFEDNNSVRSFISSFSFIFIFNRKEIEDRTHRAESVGFADLSVDIGLKIKISHEKSREIRHWQALLS